MKRREDALREALATNSEETQRWENYKKENETAIENLDRFGKHLNVNVMVPIGRKAYMPGQLIHTNEVLVGHFQGYFSKCSAYKAAEICRHRIDKATENLEKLATEKNLWENKLKKPYSEGVLPDSETLEIVEDYDEEKEKLWREEHKRRVKHAKYREKLEREGADAEDKSEKTDTEILKIFEEAELMEELENELEKLEIEEISNETVKKLMSGEMKLPAAKSRVAHFRKDSSEVVLKTADVIGNNNLQRIVKKSDMEANFSSFPITNNNNRQNPEIQIADPLAVDEEDNTDIDEDLPPEVRNIKEQAKFLNPTDQVDFYECQIKIIRQKLLQLPVKNDQDMVLKVNFFNALECLETLLEMAEDAAVAEEQTALGEGLPYNAEEDVAKAEEKVENIKKQKRRISFALQDDTLEFRKNETVSEMLPKVKPDIVTLDDTASKKSKLNITKSESINESNKLILDKVEKNLQYMAENQSKHDFDMVNKILESSSGKSRTLEIKFEFSNPCRPESQNLESESIPSSPADFYDTYLKSLSKEKPSASEAIFLNAYEGESDVRVPTLKESERNQAYVDPRLEFSKLTSLDKEENTESSKRDTAIKSILRNKNAVERENHIVAKEKNTKKSKKKKSTAVIDDENFMSAYYKVMKDVVETPLTEPEPLPEGKYIDAHAPKKRVSRFKQNRGATE